MRISFRIDLRNFELIPGIDFNDAGAFVNNLRLVITHSVDLMCDLVKVRLSDDDANQFCAAEFHAIAFDRLGDPPLI